MADPPAWRYDLDAPARFVAAHGLATGLVGPSAPLDGESWDRLVATCERHGLTGLLVDAVASGELAVTPAQRAEAGWAEAGLVRRRIDYERQVAPILGLFDDAGIEVRVLKGAAVARCDYPDDQLRGTSDLDLLVRADQIDHAVSVLNAVGGVRTDPDPTPGWSGRVGKGATVEVADLALEVDLHRILVWGPLGVRVPPGELWDRSRSFDLAGSTRYTLGREETVLHACAHVLILGVVRAREVRDVAQMVTGPALDVTRLMHLARRWGQEAVLATAVALADRELALRDHAHRLSGWAERYRVRRLDGLWLRTGAAYDRLHGLEQAGVFWELRHDPVPSEARRMLLRANFRPREGTYGSPWARVARLARRAVGGGS